MKGSKNKGDWSEFYVLLYLLGYRNLYAADENLEKMAGYCFPIKKVMREDTPNTKVDFVIDGINTVKIYINSVLARTMESEQFISEASTLYREILEGNKSFDIPRAEELLREMHLERITAPSTDVTDITMEVHDSMTSIDQVMGFSIKSYIGGAPTLLNASGATNFIFEVSGLDDEQISEINAIHTRTKIIDRISEIYNRGGNLSFSKIANDTFAGNLLMIDTKMEEILSHALLYSYKEKEQHCKAILDKMELDNPLGFKREGLYVRKFKQFLCAKALGMDPSVKWSGEDAANGGYIVAKSDGEVLAYHLYNRDKFMQYLFENTKFERASTTKHNFASLYKCDGKVYINLNLQIRFI